MATWGVTEVDDARRDTLVLVLEDRLLSGLGKKLQAWLKLKGAPIRKVALKVDGQEVDEDASEAEGISDPAAAMPVSPAAKPTADAKDTADELLRLTQLFKRLAPDIKKALLAQKSTAKDLAQLVKACQQTLGESDVVRARLSLQQLAVRLRQVEAVERIEPQLGHAVLRVQHLAADLKNSAQRKKLAEQGAATVDTVRQLRAAKRGGMRLRSRPCWPGWKPRARRPARASRPCCPPSTRSRPVIRPPTRLGWAWWPCWTSNRPRMAQSSGLAARTMRWTWPSSAAGRRSNPPPAAR